MSVHIQGGDISGDSKTLCFQICPILHPVSEGDNIQAI